MTLTIHSLPALLFLAAGVIAALQLADPRVPWVLVGIAGAIMFF